MDKVNGYSLFVQEFSSKNRRYETFHQASKVAAPYWKALPTAEKEEYKRRAKKLNSGGGNTCKFNSAGVSIEVIEHEEAEKKQAIIRMTEEMKKIFYDLDFENMLDVPFYVGHLNYHVAPPTTKGEVLPAELAILKFNLRDGIKQCFHRLIYAGEIKSGFYSCAKEQSERTHKLLNPMIGVRSRTELYNDIMSFMTNSNKKCAIPIIYAMPDDTALNDSLIALRIFLTDLQVMVEETGRIQRRSEFRVYPLPTLFCHFYNDLREKYNEDISQISESLANAMLSKDTYMYSTGGAACKVHEQDENIHCSKCKVVRCAFAFFDHVLPVIKMKPIEGYHVPGNQMKCVIDKIEALQVSFANYYGDGQYVDKQEGSWRSNDFRGLEHDVQSMSLEDDFPALGSGNAPQLRKWGENTKQLNNFAGQFVPNTSTPESGIKDFPPLGNSGRKKGSSRRKN